MVSQNYVLRSVYLEPEIDNFLREQAFNLSVSKNDLIRKYVLAGAKLELESALSAEPASSARRSLSTGVLRAARGAKILAPAERSSTSVRIGGTDVLNASPVMREASRSVQKTLGAPKKNVVSKKTKTKNVTKKAVNKAAKKSARA